MIQQKGVLISGPLTRMQKSMSCMASNLDVFLYGAKYLPVCHQALVGDQSIAPSNVWHFWYCYSTVKWDRFTTNSTVGIYPLLTFLSKLCGRLAFLGNLFFRACGNFCGRNLLGVRSHPVVRFFEVFSDFLAILLIQIEHVSSRKKNTSQLFSILAATNLSDEVHRC